MPIAHSAVLPRGRESWDIMEEDLRGSLMGGGFMLAGLGAFYCDLPGS